MYQVRKQFEISSSHKLTLDYGSKCRNLHGHNWKIIVTCQSESLDKNGMVIDFTKIKELVSKKLDHQDITDKICIDGRICNPTAENIAKWISEQIGEKCASVLVQESEGNIAEWRR